MSDVAPLPNRERRQTAKRVTTPHVVASDRETTFIVENSGECVSGRAHGVNRKTVRALRAGRHPIIDTLDLHRTRVDPARERLERFIEQRARAGGGCVRVIHGRGLHSTDGAGKLRALVPQWLATGALADRVAAYCSAAPHDGGVGALYVLIKKGDV
jgi:DNA-nicking Smr family endonuclease